MNVIDKIRAEIERLKGICTAQIKANPGQTFPFVMEMTGYDKLLSFLDTLEPVSDDLEEAAEKKYPVYWKNYPKDGIVRSESSYDTNKQCRDAFKAGAEWQEKQDLGWAGEIHKNGYNLCKEQMMEGAVEGVVCYGSKGAYIETDFLGEYDTDVYGNPGDKVKIIVVKEDKK